MEEAQCYETPESDVLQQTILLRQNSIKKEEIQFSLFFSPYVMISGCFSLFLPSQVVLSSDPSFVSQLSGPDSHGLRHLTPGQNTDVLHLCGSHTNMHTHSQLYIHRCNAAITDKSLSGNV